MRLIRLIKLNVMIFFLFTQLQFLFEFLSLEFFENLAFFWKFGDYENSPYFGVFLPIWRFLEIWRFLKICCFLNIWRFLEIWRFLKIQHFLNFFFFWKFGDFKNLYTLGYFLCMGRFCNGEILYRGDFLTGTFCNGEIL